MSINKLSRFRECQNCKHKFIVPPVTLLYERIHNNPIFCPRCNSDNIAQIKEF